MLRNHHANPPPKFPKTHKCAEGMEFLISVVSISSLISEYKHGV